MSKPYRDLLAYLIDRRTGDHTIPAFKCLQPWASFLFEGGKSIDIRRYDNKQRGWMGILASGWDHYFDGKREYDSWRNKPQLCLLGFGLLYETRIYETRDKFAADFRFHLNPPDFFNGRRYGWCLDPRVQIKPLYYVHKKNEGKRPLLTLIGQMARCRINITEILEKAKFYE